MLFAAVTIPILNVSLSGLGSRFCREVFEIGMIVRSKLAVFLSADFANRFFCTVCFSERVPSDALFGSGSLRLFRLTEVMAVYRIFGLPLSSAEDRASSMQTAVP